MHSRSQPPICNKAHNARMYSGRLILIACLFLLAGCASPPAVRDTDRPLSPVYMGRVLDLISVPTNGLRTTALLDARGDAHVLVLAPEAKAAFHVVVTPEETFHVEPIATDVTAGDISGAIDGDGVLHVLLGDRHLVRDADGWRGAEPPPWVTAGLHAEEPMLVSAVPQLAWAFLVDGKEIEAPGYWTLLIGGGFGAGFLLPWHLQSIKLVVATGEAWHVVDLQHPGRIAVFRVLARPNGALFAVYGVHTVPEYYELSYAEITGPREGAETGPGDAAKGAPLRSVEGRPVPVIHKVLRGHWWFDVAVDVSPDTVLIVQQGTVNYEGFLDTYYNFNTWLFEKGHWRAQEWSPAEVGLDLHGARIVSAGGGVFHVVVDERGISGSDHAAGCDLTVLYLQFAQGGWSAPMVVGCIMDEQSWWEGVPSFDYDIAGADNGSAFVVWPTRGGVQGRWILREPRN